MKNIVVVGGGTAGWFTALMAKSYYEFVNITVIESSEIGILGAGEGTTPHFLRFLREINIELNDVIREADATIKNGIRFINWHGDGTDYFHSFTVDPDYAALDNFTVLMAQIDRFHRFDEIDLPAKLTAKHKVPFYKNGSGDISINNVKDIGRVGIHFNARKFAAYLQKVAKQRGIRHIDGRVTQVHTNESGDITGLALEGREAVVDCDFVFDCSGFARLLIGKHYKSPWISYSDRLPMKRAIPFFIEHDGDVAPETKSIAMSSGWVWQIPVQGRYGCGYVFDSDYITDEQALAEAEDLFGRKLQVPRAFNFSAGTHQHTLINNCLAIGLSQSFVEPLEATSIWIAFVNLHDFLNNNGLFVQNPIYENSFNERCRRRNNEVKDFIYLHYLTQRQDSQFWREFRQKNPMIGTVSDTLSLISEYPYINLDGNMFNNSSWLQVGHGLQAIQLDNYYRTFEFCDHDYSNHLRDQAQRKQDNIINSCIDHKLFVEAMR